MDDCHQIQRGEKRKGGGCKESPKTEIKINNTSKLDLFSQRVLQRLVRHKYVKLQTATNNAVTFVKKNSLEVIVDTQIRMAGVTAVV